MKTLKIYCYLLLTLTIMGCKNESQKTRIEKPIESKKKLTQINILKNIDDNFKTFLDNFSKDSVFQISRVIFPLKVTELDYNNELESIVKIIQKKEYTKLDFEYPKDALTREFDRYTQNIKTKGNKAVVEIRGVDNGIYSDFYFEKINGKWHLKSWNDSSN